MKILNLEYVKRHSRICCDCEDDVLQVYAEAAEDAVLQLLDRTVEDIVEEYGEVPAAIGQAALLLTENSYAHRAPVEAANMSVVPYSFDLLVKPYMRL